MVVPIHDYSSEVQWTNQHWLLHRKIQVSMMSVLTSLVYHLTQFFSEWFQSWEILFASSILPNLCTSCCYYSWLVVRFDDLIEKEDVESLESNVDSGQEIDSQDTSQADLDVCIDREEEGSLGGEGGWEESVHAFHAGFLDGDSLVLLLQLMSWVKQSSWVEEEVLLDPKTDSCSSDWLPLHNHTHKELDCPTNRICPQHKIDDCIFDKQNTPNDNCNFLPSWPSQRQGWSSCRQSRYLLIQIVCWRENEKWQKSNGLRLHFTVWWERKWSGFKLTISALRVSSLLITVSVCREQRREKAN